MPATWLFVNGSESIWIERPYGCTLVIAGPGSLRKRHEFADEHALNAFQAATARRLAQMGWTLWSFDSERRHSAERRTTERDSGGRRHPLTRDVPYEDHGRRMSWQCPACRLPIQHSELEGKPREGTRYRCHVCRLELVFDPNVNRMTVAPISEDESEPERRQVK
jgi:hypothetical protein